MPRPILLTELEPCWYVFGLSFRLCMRSLVRVYIREVVHPSGDILRWLLANSIVLGLAL